LNTLAHQHQSRTINNHRSHPPISNNSLSKPISNSIADLSLAIHNSKISSATIRLSSFQSKLDNYNHEFYKKIPLTQNYDWGMLAITNTNLILLYNKDKGSLVIFDSNGHENEVNNFLFQLNFKFILFREFNGQMEK
jgi:hypothetical protein